MTMTTFNFFSKILGTSFKPDASEIMGSFMNPGDLLYLQVEPDNKFDKNAIQIFFGEEALGYVARDTAKKINQDVIDGNVICTVSNITGQGMPNSGCNIELNVVREGDKK